ncbi:hypothetical protein [Morganella psychrotolerans]|uniref:hypothetical protein n=1 Tax=Morganella psychrotolerans TaxID=368603 RepID=UPI0039B085BB
MPVQEVQTHQVPAHIENDLYGTVGADSQSSYVSSSGIKSILLNAWNAVKSAFSGMLSSFGSHLCRQQGSDKPGREITHEMSSFGENIYEELDNYRVVGHETETAEVDDPANHIYEDLDNYRAAGHETETAEVDDPANHIYEDLDNYRASGSITDYENKESACGSSGEDIYAEPYSPLTAGSTPANDPRGESDYDTPWKSEPDATLKPQSAEQLQQRIMRERLNTL